jgi:hypothetical protein
VERVEKSVPWLTRVRRSVELGTPDADANEDARGGAADADARVGGGEEDGFDEE